MNTAQYSYVALTAGFLAAGVALILTAHVAVGIGCVVWAGLAHLGLAAMLASDARVEDVVPPPLADESTVDDGEPPSWTVIEP